MIKNQERKTTQPALIMLYGGTEKNYRSIEKDAVVIGRARGCDIGLDAPDVSSLHCIIWRTSAGLQIRDCGSRAGTKLNGDAIKEAFLHDGDILQIGPFSFRVFVPPALSSNQMRDARFKHLEQSRRKLGRLAVGLRRKIREMAKLMEISGSDASLQQKASGLRTRVRDYEQRARQLEQDERELSQDRELLENERSEHQAKVQQTEHDLARRQAEVEAELQKRLADFQQQCQKEEEHLKEVARTQGDAMVKKQATVGNSNELQDTAIEQAEASLREQRAELARMMADLRSMHELVRQQQSTDVQAVKEENAALRRQLEDLEKTGSLAANPDPTYLKELEEIQAENLALRQLLEERESLPGPNEKIHHELETLKADNHLLRQLLETKELVLEELRNNVQTSATPEVPAPSEPMDIDTFEAELNQFRRQLEADREKLNAEFQALRLRNEELDETTRDLEMEMSRERAEMARERTRLERLRDEVKADLERMQRDGGVRESLAPVQRLRDELNQRRQPQPVPAAAKTPSEDNLNDRLRTFRSRLTE